MAIEVRPFSSITMLVCNSFLVEENRVAVRFATKIYFRSWKKQRISEMWRNLWTGGFQGSGSRKRNEKSDFEVFSGELLVTAVANPAPSPTNFDPSFHVSQSTALNTVLDKSTFMHYNRKVCYVDWIVSEHNLIMMQFYFIFFLIVFRTLPCLSYYIK